MYALMALLGAIASVAFIHAFVYRRRKYVPVFAIAQSERRGGFGRIVRFAPVTIVTCNVQV